MLPAYSTRPLSEVFFVPIPILISECPILISECPIYGHISDSPTGISDIIPILQPKKLLPVGNPENLYYRAPELQGGAQCVWCALCIFLGAPDAYRM